MGSARLRGRLGLCLTGGTVETRNLGSVRLLAASSDFERRKSRLASREDSDSGYWLWVWRLVLAARVEGLGLSEMLSGCCISFSDAL